MLSIRDIEAFNFANCLIDFVYPFVELKVDRQKEIGGYRLYCRREDLPPRVVIGINQSQKKADLEKAAEFVARMAEVVEFKAEPGRRDHRVGYGDSQPVWREYDLKPDYFNLR